MVALVTADSFSYTADSDCIHADGYNGCAGGYSGGYGGYIPDAPPRRLKDKKHKRQGDSLKALRQNIRDSFEKKIEAHPTLRLMSQEDKDYILDQDDIEGIIAVLLLM